MNMCIFILCCLRQLNNCNNSFSLTTFQFPDFSRFSRRVATLDKVHHRQRAAIQQVCQHRLQQASLYLQHTMMSALCHDYQGIFN